MRVRRWPRISTSSTVPSGITTGPSGNSRSVARTRLLPMNPPRLLRCRWISGPAPHARHFVARVYGKAALACQASTDDVMPQGSVAQNLFPDRHPDLEAAIAGGGIELLVIALEIGRIGHLESRGRQPVIPDGVDGAPDGRDVLAVGKDDVFQ